MLRTLKNLFKQDREKFVVPKSVQNVIPIKTIWEDGIFLVGRNKYAKTFKFEDINYAVASREDKEAMFLEYSELLNSLDSGATTKITINNRRLNKADFEQTILIPMADDGLDKYRKEYNKMLLDKATGANSIVQDKYVTVSVCKKNIEEARNYFARVGADLIAHFNRLGSKCVELDAGDKLRIFHDFYRTGEETAFHFDITQTMRKGHDFKDFICPDTFEFESDCFRMGDRYGRVIFLREYAAYIKDSMVAELCELNRNMMLSVDIIPVPTDEAVQEVENRLLGVETNITNWQRKQNQNNNFSAVIPYDLEQQRKESKEFLDDLTTRDQRMMFAVLTMVHTADTKEQLDNDTEALLTTARKHLCQFAVLKYQQMDGLNTALPFGVRKIDALRTLTTESLAVFIPFRVQEIYHENGVYYGQNVISKNMIIANRRQLLNGNSFILGVSGAGKSFTAKEEMTNIILTDPNILGYDRVGDTYVINEEQAETVRMIYDLYLQGYGSMKIAKILTERKRKTASGLIKWSVSNIMRAIKNATYTGTKCYNKSRSNNFLEQKRINNLDMSTYEYVEGDFPSIISQEIWNKAQAIRESRVKPVCVSAGKNTHSKRDSRDIWVNKLRCSCGSSYRKNKWHTKLDGKTSYGYQCYNQLNNGIKRKRAEIGLDTEGYCDSRMITDWKLDFMAKALLEHLWTERKESVLIALDLIKYYYKEEKSNETQSDTVTIQAKLDKANSRLTNLIAMRADGEISKDEYQAMRSPVDEEIKKLQKALDEIPQEKSNPKGLDIEGIRSTLNSFIDFSGSTISHDVVNQFVYLITPTSDTTFDWYVNLNGTADVKATFTAEGRKKNCIIKLEEIEKISSVHREKNEDNAHFIKNPHIFTYLHRQLSTTNNSDF